MPLRDVDHVDEAVHTLLGIAAWPPPPTSDGSCPVCGQGPLGWSTACLWCDAVSLDLDAQIKAKTSKAEARKLAAAAEAKARKHLDRSNPVLSEKDKRRIWNGYVGMLGRETVGEEVTNRAMIGRRWLAEIGQLPNWELELKRRPADEGDDS